MQGGVPSSANNIIDITGDDTIETNQTEQNNATLSSNAQALLSNILKESEDSNSLIGKINNSKGITTTGARDLIKKAYDNKVISETDYNMLKEYFK